MPKKLIEVARLLEAINAAARCENDAMRRLSANLKSC